MKPCVESGIELIKHIPGKREIEELSANVRKLIDGQDIDVRDNREGALSKLRNDIHTLVTRRNEEVDALQKERDTLKDTLADISHQIKTPLTSISIMTDLLENAPAEKQAEFTANIRRGIDRTEWLVSALLKMAKLDAGAVDFTRENVPSRALIELALEPMRILLDVKNQHITVNVDNQFQLCDNLGLTETSLRAERSNPEMAISLDCFVADAPRNDRLFTRSDVRLLCDRRWTAEALGNIIKNASEHSPNGSDIRVESGANPICAWVSVTDSGDGINRAEIANLFKRFQGSRSDTGYGIGLPLALAIMRGQNGDIEVDIGGNGVGATFTLKIYRKTAAEK